MLYSENIHLTSKGISFTDKNGKSLGLDSALKKGGNRVYNWWLDFKLYIINSIAWSPFWFIRKLFYQSAGVRIGRGSKIHVGARFFEPGGIEIGDDTLIGERSFLDGRDKLKIGSHVDIASEVMIYNSEHDLSNPEFSAICQPVSIADYVFIGPRAIILPGVTIKQGAVVAAGAVVVKDVQEFSIVGGIPAKEIGLRKHQNLSYRLGRSRLFQ